MRQPKYLMWFVPMLLVTLSAQAHDPREHLKDAQKPDCMAMKDMDHSKMDMKDPVIQAIMQRCMKEIQGNPVLPGAVHVKEPNDYGKEHKEKSKPENQH